MRRRAERVRIVEAKPSRSKPKRSGGGDEETAKQSVHDSATAVAEFDA